MLDQMEKKLNDLMGKMQALQEEKDKIRQEGRALFLDYVKARWGIAPGVVIVKTTLGKKGNEQFRVVSIEDRMDYSSHSLSRRPWVTANPKKKDGTWGVAVRSIYDDWEIVTT